MTVKELIEKLSKYPAHTRVVVNDRGDGYPTLATSVTEAIGGYDGMGGAFLEGRGGNERFVRID